MFLFTSNKYKLKVSQLPPRLLKCVKRMLCGEKVFLKTKQRVYVFKIK